MPPKDARAKVTVRAQLMSPGCDRHASRKPTMTNTVLTAQGLGRRYGRRWALSDCTLSVPAGRIVGLVGPNGAGKTTLLRLAVGLLTPTTGTISVVGGRPASDPHQLGRVGYVAQET